MNQIKEMVYYNERKSLILAESIYNNIPYIIISHGTHPCVYLGISKDSIFAGLNYDEIPLSCHGGLTYADYSKNSCELSMLLPNTHYWIGWDYAHYGDYTNFMIKGKKWTTDELIEDAQKAIDDLNRLLAARMKHETK